MPESASPSMASPALTKASELDAKGLYEQAMEALKTASKAGDIAAMTELAHRLLIGDRAPKSPKHALFFLKDAAKNGDARALARLAALTAAGAYIPQDFQQALQLLAQAAAKGDAAAQGQLLSLQTVEPSSPDWFELAARVNLPYWLQTAATEALHPKLHRVMELAPMRVCRWLISRAQGRLQRALVYDAVAKENQQHAMRTNSMALFDYANFDVVQFLLQARMAATCGYPIQNFEAPMILHYATGQEITPHFDFIDANAADYARQLQEYGQRMITFLLYLNDEYDGGETTFPELGLSNRGGTGDGLYFINAHADLTPDRHMLHTGSPPKRGEKWIVSQFIVSMRLRP